MQTNPRLTAIIEHLLRQSSLPASARLAVGELVPFADEQIRAQWEASPLANIALVIRRVPARQQCMACFGTYYPKQGEVACPFCKGVGAKIVAGEEFFLEATEEAR